MFKCILVPLDGSALAERALPSAGRLARAMGASVVLLLVANSAYQDYGQQTSFASTPPLDPQDTERAHSKARHYLTEIAAQPAFAGFEVDVSVESGSVATTILDVARARSADLIVMSSHGRTGVARWVLGSVAQKVARHAAVPVLVVPRDGWNLDARDNANRRALRALVALDGSALAEAAVVPAATVIAAVSAPERAELHLIKILPSASRSVPAPTVANNDPNTLRAPSAEEAAREYLGGLVERLHKGPLSGLDVTVTWSVAYGEDVAATLVGEAERATANGGPEPVAFDLLAMATHGRGGFARWATGSVTERVLEIAKLPLLVVRPRLPAATEALPLSERAADDLPSAIPPLY